MSAGTWMVTPQNTPAHSSANLWLKVVKVAELTPNSSPSLLMMLVRTSMPVLCTSSMLDWSARSLST